MSRLEKNRESERANGKFSSGTIKASPKRVALVVLAVILALVAFSAAMASRYVNSKLDKIEDLVDPDENWEDYDLSCVDVDGYINILVLGVDARDMNEMDDWRSDAIMIISIKEETGDVNITSIYRDTFLYMAGQGFYDKITHAFYYGGIKESIKSINQCLDLNIKNYVIFNFNAAADIIDAMGGIDLDIEEYEIKELNRANRETWELTDREDRGDAQQIETPGLQHVDGSMAVSYGRIRKGVGDDYKRTERMRIIVDKLLEKSRDLSASQLNEILNIAIPEIKTNLSNSDIIGLAYKLMNFKIVGSSSFPYSIDDGYVGAVSYVFPVNLYEDVKTFHEICFGQNEYTPSEIVANISAAILQYKGGTSSAPTETQSEGEGYGGTNSWSQEYLPPETPSQPATDTNNSAYQNENPVTPDPAADVDDNPGGTDNTASGDNEQPVDNESPGQTEEPAPVDNGESGSGEDISGGNDAGGENGSGEAPAADESSSSSGGESSGEAPAPEDENSSDGDASGEG